MSTRSIQSVHGPVYNFFFHPLSKEHSIRKTAASIASIAGLSIFTLGVYLVAFVSRQVIDYRHHYAISENTALFPRDIHKEVAAISDMRRQTLKSQPQEDIRTSQSKEPAEIATKYLAVLKKALIIATEVSSDETIPEDEKLNEFNTRFAIEETTGAILENRNVTFQQHCTNIKKMVEQISTLSYERTKELSGFLEGISLTGCLEGRMDPVWDFLATPTLIDPGKPVITNIAFVLKHVFDQNVRIIETAISDPFQRIARLKIAANKRSIICEACSLKEFTHYLEKHQSEMIGDNSLDKVFDDYIHDYINDELIKRTPLFDFHYKAEQMIEADKNILPEMQRGLHFFAKNKVFEIAKNEPEKQHLIGTDGTVVSYSEVISFVAEKNENPATYPKGQLVLTVFGMLNRVAEDIGFSIILQNGIYVKKDSLSPVILI